MVNDYIYISFLLVINKFIISDIPSFANIVNILDLFLLVTISLVLEHYLLVGIFK